VTAIDRSRLDSLITQTIEGVLSNRWPEFIHQYEADAVEVDWTKLQAQIEMELRRLLRREFQSNPLLVFLLQSPIEQPVKVSRRQRTRSSAVESEATAAKVAS